MLKLIFPDFRKNWIPDPENPKPGKFFLRLYLEQREYFALLFLKLHDYENLIVAFSHNFATREQHFIWAVLVQCLIHFSHYA